MALINKLKAIGDGFRTSRGTTQEYSLDEMAVLAAEPVGGSGSAVIEPLTVTENGIYTAPDGVDGYSPVTVNVAGSGDDGSFKALIERTATEITLPSDLTSIGKYVFYNHTELALTSLPDGVTSIGGSAFQNCTNLALTSLPSGITSIGGNAFYNCTNLTEITFKGKPNTINNTAFKECTNLLTINVPWAEGEVSGAPWGAENARINYNYTGG